MRMSSCSPRACGHAHTRVHFCIDVYAADAGALPHLEPRAPRSPPGNVMSSSSSSEADLARGKLGSQKKFAACYLFAKWLRPCHASSVLRAIALPRVSPHPCMDGCSCACETAHKSTRTRIHAHTHTHTRTHAHTHTHTHTCAHIHTHALTRTHARTHACTRTHRAINVHAVARRSGPPGGPA